MDHRITVSLPYWLSPYRRQAAIMVLWMSPTTTVYTDCEWALTLGWLFNDSGRRTLGERQPRRAL